MAHIRLQNVFDDKQTLELTPTKFKPFGHGELLRTRSTLPFSALLSFVGRDTVINGEPVAGTPRVNATVSFEHGPAPYALVPGGWLPMPFVTPQYFVVDRNVVSTLRHIREQGPPADQLAFAWWSTLFDGATALFNPMLYALEGNKRRTPSPEEFKVAFLEGAAEIERALPKAQIVRYGPEHFEACNELIRDLTQRSLCEAKFFKSIAPLVAQRAPAGKEARIKEEILRTAQACELRLASFPVIAALSTLYEDVHGEAKSPGRALMKPRARYSDQDAYNAVSDLRHIELAAASQGFPDSQRFALCTNDLGIAAFWCATQIRSEIEPTNAISLSFTFTEHLFARLDEGATHALARELLETQV
jgi:hypothetical protein